MKSVENPTTFYCEKCRKNVAVNEEKPGSVGTAQMRHALVDECGHVVAERASSDDAWKASK